VTAFQAFVDREVDALWDKIGVRISPDDGDTWGPLQFIEVDEFPEGAGRPFDPTITFNPDDGRWRMYFSVNADGGRELNENVCTHSAVSEDAVTYTYDEGTRFCTEGRAVIDPAVAQVGGTWYFTAPRGAPQDGSFFGFSNDGLTFTEGDPVPSDRNHSLTGNLLDVDGNLRLYATEVLFPTGNFMFWSESPNGGATWSEPTRTTIPAGKDPGIVRLDDGTFVMWVPTETR
jgi:hypothetical protein